MRQHWRECPECPAGYYQNQERQTLCIACAIGRYTDQRETREPLHTYTGGSKKCKGCPVGRYGDEIASTRPLKADIYPLGPMCKACKLGQYGNVNNAKQDYTAPNWVVSKKGGRTAMANRFYCCLIHLKHCTSMFQHVFATIPVPIAQKGNTVRQLVQIILTLVLTALWVCIWILRAPINKAIANHVRRVVTDW